MAMKKIYFIILILGIGCNTEQPFVINRGVNLSHWLSQSKKSSLQRDNFVTKEDLIYLKNNGFDHVRLPLDEVQMWTKDHKKNDTTFKLMHNALKWCNELKMKVIVDFHIPLSHYFSEDHDRRLFTDTAAQNRFVKCWQELSDELKNYPNSEVAYEIMNEPVAKWHSQWNTVMLLGYNTIRKLEPNRTIFIGSNMWQQAQTFDSLAVPLNDSSIVLSFHFYNPMLLTHYKAKWVKSGAYQGEIKYPGKLIDTMGIYLINKDSAQAILNEFMYCDINKLEKLMMPAIEVAKKYNLRLHCGEFGCIRNTPTTYRLAWYKDMISLFNKHKIPWSCWDYKGSFYIKDNEKLIQILNQKK